MSISRPIRLTVWFRRPYQLIVVPNLTSNRWFRRLYIDRSLKQNLRVVRTSCIHRIGRAVMLWIICYSAIMKYIHWIGIDPWYTGKDGGQWIMVGIVRYWKCFCLFLSFKFLFWKIQANPCYVYKIHPPGWSWMLHFYYTYINHLRVIIDKFIKGIIIVPATDNEDEFGRIIEGILKLDFIRFCWFSTDAIMTAEWSLQFMAWKKKIIHGIFRTKLSNFNLDGHYHVSMVGSQEYSHTNLRQFFYL